MASSRDQLISREELTSLGGMMIIECGDGIVTNDVTAAMRLIAPR